MTKLKATATVRVRWNTPPDAPPIATYYYDIEDGSNKEIQLHNAMKDLEKFIMKDLLKIEWTVEKVK